MYKMVEKVMERYYNRGLSEIGMEGLTASAFLVLVTLARECTGDLGLCQVSMRKIKELTGIGSTNTVLRALRELEAKKYILALKSGDEKSSPRLYFILPARNNENKEQKPARRAERNFFIEELMQELGEFQEGIFNV